MEKLVFLNKDIYIYKNYEYNYLQLEALKRKIGKNIKIILLDSHIFIKSFKNITESPEKYIEKEFIGKITSDIDTLIHYNYRKKNRVLEVYSINDGGYIKQLLDNVISLEIIPIQFIIHKFVSKKVRDCKNMLIISNVKDNIHIVSSINGSIVSCEILDKKQFNMDSVRYDININSKIIIDKNIYNPVLKNDKILDKAIALDIGGYLDEKVFKI